MEIESVKSILFAAAAILILYQIVRSSNTDKEKLRYLIYSVIITLVILSVIEFKIHHYLRFTFHIPNTVTYLLVMFLLVYYLYRFRKIIMDSAYILLILSLSLLASGVLLDLTSDAKIIKFTESDIAEEIFRLSGAFFWMLFFLLGTIKDEANTD